MSEPSTAVAGRLYVETQTAWGIPLLRNSNWDETGMTAVCGVSSCVGGNAGAHGSEVWYRALIVVEADEATAKMVVVCRYRRETVYDDSRCTRLSCYGKTFLPRFLPFLLPHLFAH